MKKFNKNIIVFVFAIIFIAVGIYGDCFVELKDSLFTLSNEMKKGNIYNVFDFKDNVDSTSNKKLSYHNQLMDINSFKDNLSGTRIVNKEDETVIKADSGKLVTYQSDKVSNKELSEVVDKIDELKTVTEENGAKFLYLAAPRKENYESAPANVVNNAKINLDNFLKKLSSKNIPALDFRKSLRENNVADDQIYFYTDHHWTPNAGFIANKSICEELNTRYGFEYNKKYIDINNYNIKTYKDYFLGSYGKKVGTYFTWHGADDFDLITPKFKTDFIEEQPFKNQTRKGAFKDTVLFLENIERKDFYNLNTYCTYSGGDFRLQIIKNNLNTNGNKILLIKDSFAEVVSPFLSLQTNELHIVDVRNYAYVGDKINTYKYIEKTKPDYVLVLYSGISNMEKSTDRYNFD